jgi:hypothetical protein
MEALWELADFGVRVIFVAALVEGWIYIARLRLLLLDEDLSHERQVIAAHHVLCRLRR